MSRSRRRKTVGAPQLRRSVADLRALAHPLRLRMMELFAESPKTTKQVAELLGQPPTRLYHHVAALERAGLLLLKETRQNRGAIEKWYTSASQQIIGGKAQRRRARRAVAATVLEQARQEVAAIPTGAKEPALVMRLIVVASPSEIPAVRRWLLDAVQEMRRQFQLEDPGAASSLGNCERWALTLAFTPTTRAG
jgi:DNA-binding transcriptional ArsR family regulator